MAAQETQQAPVRLLIAEFSENAAYGYDSLLRDAGIATRTQLIDLPRAGDALRDADLMLVNAALPQSEQTIAQLTRQHPHVPIILITNDAAPLTPADGMRLGAADAVPDAAQDQLVLVFKRELERVCQYHRLCQTRRALKETEQRCELLLKSSQAAIAYVHEGMHIYANEGYLKLFGFEDADDLLGLPLVDLIDAEHVEALKQELKAFRADGEERSFATRGRSTGGATFDCTATLAGAEYEGEHCIQVTLRTAPAVAAPQAAPAEANGSASNGSAEPEPPVLTLTTPAQSNGTTISHASGTDPETFLAGAAEAMHAANGQFFAVVTVGIDGFDQLQAKHGITGAAGVARAVAQALEDGLAGAPLLAFGADRFAFSLTRPTRDDAIDDANALRQQVEALMLEVNEKTVRPTVSMGGAEIEAHDREEPQSAVTGALEAANATLQKTLKDTDGNRVELPQQTATGGSVSAEAGRVMTLINEAIESQKFMLLFQPIISLRGDSDEHYEVFLRMLDRNGKQMVPNQFLNTAIDNGLAGKIDRWVILQSIKMLSTHRAKGHNTRLTINLTCNSVTDDEFMQWLGVAIKAARLPSDAVIFQITERDAATYVRQTREFVEGLKHMHCRASLSRFGLVEEPFEVLRHIPVDLVKLDGSHIDRMVEDADYKVTVTDMIRQLQGSGKLTIVPMVESANVLSALWQAGANYIQGHYLQEPSTQMDYDFSTDD